MAAKPAKRAVDSRAPRRPEFKVGPLHNGLGCAVWLNEVQTEHGPRFFRSITLASRRYRDFKDGQWKDAASYRPVDLASLVLMLEAVREFIRTHPLPGQPVEGEELEQLQGAEDGEATGDGKVPF